jgi:hypothetical protein
MKEATVGYCKYKAMRVIVDIAAVEMVLSVIAAKIIRLYNS